MRFLLIPDFATPEECEELNRICYSGFTAGWMTPVKNGKGLFTSRFEMTTKKYPDFVYAIDYRVRKLLGILSAPAVVGQGSRGIVVSSTPIGGIVYDHKDTVNSAGDYAILRCNILTQAAHSGGELVIEGSKMKVPVGALHCYLASEHLHSVTEVHSGPDRILWMFGAYVPAEDWNSGAIAPNIDKDRN
jgi:hypothetical protein